MLLKIRKAIQKLATSQINAPSLTNTTAPGAYKKGRRTKRIVALTLVTLAAIAFLNRPTPETVPTFALPTNQKTIMIDAGHGGWDPGKPGITGQDEKHINLSIAEDLQIFLEHGGSFAVVARDADEALSTRKKDDLYQRTELSDASGADITVSIHQNSYPSADVKGAQVFYHESSEKGKLLAELVQKSINEFADVGNSRAAKSSEAYYILKNTKAPAIIVECGFISNPGDEAKLNTQAYQEKMAWAIYSGINDFFAAEAPPAAAE